MCKISWRNFSPGMATLCQAIIGRREFQNREHHLPPGHYREYDVNPKIRGRARNAEQIVVERDAGKAYYSGNHY
ncbi:MAG: hypothetical protein H0Z54_01570 [Nitrospira sp.]|nr:hypothetical protein [Nitrospira sp.]